MSESAKSQKFIKEQKEKYGRFLEIEKIIRNDRKGQPDIQAVFRGMSVSAEAKLINSISYQNLYPFDPLQLDILETKSRAGIMSIGLLFKDNEVRYLMWYDLKQYLDKSDWDKAKIFSFEILRKEWLNNLEINV